MSSSSEQLAKARLHNKHYGKRSNYAQLQEIREWSDIIDDYILKERERTGSTLQEAWYVDR